MSPLCTEITSNTLEKLLPLDLHGMKFEQISGILDPISCIFPTQVKNQGAGGKFK